MQALKAVNNYAIIISYVQRSKEQSVFQSAIFVVVVMFVVVVVVVYFPAPPQIEHLFFLTTWFCSSFSTLNSKSKISLR